MESCYGTGNYSTHLLNVFQGELWTATLLHTVALPRALMIVMLLFVCSFVSWCYYVYVCIVNVYNMLYVICTATLLFSVVLYCTLNILLRWGREYLQLSEMRGLLSSLLKDSS